MLPVLLQTTPLPFSAYALCFLPLATVIIGLFTFFFLTDRHANRPYLRYNAFVAATHTPEEAAAREPAVGETPAGPLGGAPAGTTTIYTGGEVGKVVPVAHGDQPEPNAPANYQPSFEGTSKGIGHTAADDAPPRPGDLDYRAPDPATEGAVKPTLGGVVYGATTAPTEEAPTIQNVTLGTPVETARTSARRVGIYDTGAGAPTAGVTTEGVTIVHVDFNAAGADVAGEYVQIANVSNRAVDLTGWTLRDQRNKHTFTFAGFVLAAGSDVRIWTGSGTNDASNLYWGSNSAIWNNQGDAAVLEDVSGTEVSRQAYDGDPE